VIHARIAAIRAELETVSHVCPPRGEVWLLVDPDPVPVAPPLPSVDERIRDLVRAGWGGRERSLTRGLWRTGMSYADAVRAVEERARDGRLVWRGGMLVPWMIKGATT